MGGQRVALPGEIFIEEALGPLAQCHNLPSGRGCLLYPHYIVDERPPFRGGMQPAGGAVLHPAHRVADPGVEKTIPEGDDGHLKQQWYTGHEAVCQDFTAGRQAQQHRRGERHHGPAYDFAHTEVAAGHYGETQQNHRGANS